MATSAFWAAEEPWLAVSVADVVTVVLSCLARVVIASAGALRYCSISVHESSTSKTDGKCSEFDAEFTTYGQSHAP